MSMNSAPKKIISYLSFSAVAFAIVMFLSAPRKFSESVSEGISLWAADVLPAAFPFLFLTSLLLSLQPFLKLAEKISPAAGKIFRVSGAGAGAAILACVSGYPVGARMLYDLKTQGRLCKDEIFRLSCLVTTSGPPFLVGTVGSLMFQSVRAGWILLFSHLGGVWTVCGILRFFGKTPKPSPLLLPPKKDALFDSLYHAVISVLCVGGWIALFTCFGDMLESLGLFSLFGGNPLAEGFLRGLLEMTSGCAVLSSCPSPLSLALCCAIVTFGGLCVLFQEFSYLTKAGVKALPFLGIKLLQAALAFALCYILSLLIPARL